MKRLLLILCLVLAIQAGKAQVILGFTIGEVFMIPDTVNMSQSYSYDVHVKNNGNQVFQDSIIIYVAVYDLLGTLFTFHSQTHSPGMFPFFPGDSTTITVAHPIDPVYFQDGNNTVVIWPAAPGAITEDSLEKVVFVINLNGIAENTKNPVHVYPNPVKDRVFIQSEVSLEQVRIYNTSGQLIGSHKQTAMVDLSALKPGFYLLEIEDANGTIKRVKIIKE